MPILAIPDILSGMIYNVLLAFAVAFLGTACSLAPTNVRTSFETLSGRGIIPLKDENSYLIGNQVLERELEKSATLQGFIETRGRPLAFDVRAKLLAGTEVNLYYPLDNQYYALEQQGKGWLINGPYRLSDQQLKDIETSIPEGQAPPPQKLPAKNAKVKANPTPVPAETDDTAFINQLVESLALDNVELTPKGDLIHEVMMKGETLTLLARWFTLDESTATRLSRINGLPLNTELPEGESIVIPRYLLKNKKVLSREALKALRVR